MKYSAKLIFYISHKHFSFQFEVKISQRLESGSQDFSFGHVIFQPKEWI